MDHLISVIMPCYNASEYISYAIESVLNQSYKNWELLIIDDSSSDNSVDIIKRYQKIDSRIILLTTNNPSGSPSEPRNIGIEHAKGEYIAFLDTDDYWSHSKLDNQVVLFSNNVGIIYSDYQKVTEKYKFLGKSVRFPKCHTYESLLKGNDIVCSSAIIDVRVLGKKAIKFKAIGHEDFDFWLSILKKGYIAKNTETIDVFYMVRNNSVSSNKLKVIGWLWHIFYNEQNFSAIKSLNYIFVCLLKSTIKRLK